MKPKVSFSYQMQALVAKEMADAHGDHDRVGEVIERLTNSLAFVVAVGASGNAKGIDTMLTGVTSHLYECAANHAKIAAFMARRP